MKATDRIRAEARRIGFVAAGVAELGPSRRGRELQEWLDKGYAGTMRYLHRQAVRRKAPDRIVPGARTVVVVLENYLPRTPPGPGVKVARYAQGLDYHQAMGERLERLARFLQQEGATVTRWYVDAGPVPERELAERAGLGWIGKNTMLIRPGMGSWFFIGSVFSDLDLPPTPPLDLDRCGSCTRCLDACPTQAFVAPRILDATRCLSYLTIEQKGPIPAEIESVMDGWAFGCDICNEVCPWNERFAEPTEVAAYEPAAGGGPVTDDPAFFDRMTEEAFAERFGRTPFARPGLKGMRRNWNASFRSQSA